MTATPAVLRDFAVGFSLSEGIVSTPAEIQEFTIVAVDGGVELRMWIALPLQGALETRRRRLAGATGCGMCGLETLAEAMRPAPPVPAAPAFTPHQIMQ